MLNLKRFIDTTNPECQLLINYKTNILNPAEPIDSKYYHVWKILCRFLTEWIFCQNRSIRFNRLPDAVHVLCLHSEFVLLAGFQVFADVRRPGNNARHFLPVICSFFTFLNDIPCRRNQSHYDKVCELDPYLISSYHFIFNF